MVTSVLSAAQKVYSGARRNLTLASMNHKYSRALSGKGSGVGRVHISRFTTPSDAQAILTRAQYIKEGQKDLQRQKPNVKLPTIHAPRANLSGLALHERATLLEGANLERANLSKAELRGATFKDANLKYTDLTHANLNDVMQRGKTYQTSFEGADLQGADLTGALMSKKARATATVRPDTKMPTQLTSERSGYTYLGGEFNQGVKVSPKFTTKVLGSYHPPEVENMQIIQKRLKDFETHQPELAQKLKLGENLVHYKGHFIPKQEPEKLYLVMDTAKGTPLRDTNLSKTDRDKVQKSVNAYNKLLKENLGFVLGDRNQGNLFVQLDEQGQLKLDEAGEPMIQHIDYGIIDWY